MPKAALDVDLTVITRYGEQEHASKGYNPTKPGRSSHHPLIAVLTEANMTASVRLRLGASSSSTTQHILSKKELSSDAIQTWENYSDRFYGSVFCQSHLQKSQTVQKSATQSHAVSAESMM